MRLLITYCVSGEEPLATLARTLRLQHELNPRAGEFDFLLVCDEGDTDPPPSLPCLRAPLYDDGLLNVARGRNIAFRHAAAHGYDYLAVLDADGILLGSPDPPPPTGMGRLWTYFTRPGEPQDQEHADLRTEEGFYLLLSRDVFTQHFYCEEFAGYGCEDSDFVCNVLHFAGIHSSSCGVAALHLWHPRRPHYTEAGHRVNIQRLLRRAVEAMERHGAEWVPLPAAHHGELRALLRERRRDAWRAAGGRLLPTATHLSSGLRLSVFRDGRPVGVFSDLGGAIAPSVGHLAGRQGVQLVVSRGAVRDIEPSWRKVRLEGAGIASLAPDVTETHWVELPENGILIERDGGLGDLVMLLPLLQQLHRDGSYVCLACDARYVPLFSAQPELDWVIDLDVQPWPAAPVAADLRWKVDFAWDGHPMYATHHRSAVFADILETEYGVRVAPVDWTPHLVVPTAAREWAADAGLPQEPFAAVHVASASGNRTYPRTAMVLRELATRMPVVALHSVPATEIPPGVMDLCGRTSVEQAAAVVERAAVVVGPDSGMIHLAGALDVPFVAVFGPIAPELRLAHYRRYVALRGAGEGARERLGFTEERCPPCWEGVPCGIEPRPCLAEVAPEEVVAAALSLVEGEGGSK